MNCRENRTRTIIASLLIVSFVLLPVFVAAQEQRPQEQSQELQKRFASKGCIELGGSLAFMMSRSVIAGRTQDPTVTFSAMPYAGYFVLEGFEIGVNPLGIVFSKTPKDSAKTTLSLFVAPSYNFRTQGLFYPFVEGLVGYTADITSLSGGEWTTKGGLSWGGRAGVKLAIVQRGVLVVGVQYVVVTKTLSGQTTRDGSDDFTATAGFSIWF